MAERSTPKRLPSLTIARGKAAVVEMLDGLTAHGYTVLHGVGLPRVGEVDHVIVGPTGVFAVETRGWRGKVTRGSNGRLVCRGRDRTKTARRAHAEAAAIKDTLRSHGVGVYVEAVIALTRARIREPLENGEVTTLDARILADWIRDGRRSARLLPEQVARAVAIIDGTASPSFDEDVAVPVAEPIDWRRSRSA